jgi:hypothetical protein
LQQADKNSVIAMLHLVYFIFTIEMPHCH